MSLERLRRKIRTILKANGCRFHRQSRGDHGIWVSPHAPKPFTVSVTIKSRHTANKILKDAGLEKAF